MNEAREEAIGKLLERVAKEARKPAELYRRVQEAFPKASGKDIARAAFRVVTDPKIDDKRRMAVYDLALRLRSFGATAD